eukprot:2081148-Pyramimonas_sp.AAC.1
MAAVRMRPAHPFRHTPHTFRGQDGRGSDGGGGAGVAAAGSGDARAAVGGDDAERAPRARSQAAAVGRLSLFLLPSLLLLRPLLLLFRLDRDLVQQTSSSSQWPRSGCGPIP